MCVIQSRKTKKKKKTGPLQRVASHYEALANEVGNRMANCRQNNSSNSPVVNDKDSKGTRRQNQQTTTRAKRR